jgi:hypothetical protein
MQVHVSATCLHACTVLHVCLCVAGAPSHLRARASSEQEREGDSFLMRIHLGVHVCLLHSMLAGGPCLGTCVHACQDKVAHGRLARTSIFIMRVGRFYQPAILRRTIPSASWGYLIMPTPTTVIAFSSEQRKLSPHGVPSCTSRSSGSAGLHSGTWGLGGPIS